MQECFAGLGPGIYITKFWNLSVHRVCQMICFKYVQTWLKTKIAAECNRLLDNGPLIIFWLQIRQNKFQENNIYPQGGNFSLDQTTACFYRQLQRPRRQPWRRHRRGRRRQRPLRAATTLEKDFNYSKVQNICSIFYRNKLASERFRRKKVIFEAEQKQKEKKKGGEQSDIFGRMDMKGFFPESLSSIRAKLSWTCFVLLDTNLTQTFYWQFC